MHKRVAFAVLAIALFTSTLFASGSGLVISQVYGGGSSVGATYSRDYIEIFNAGASPTGLNGWSVQYTSASGTTWQSTNLTNVTLLPGQYYLVREGGDDTAPLSVTPDTSGTIAMSATNGKVALVFGTTLISGSCPAVADFAGYGTADCHEGPTAAPGLSATTADFRALSGCQDTDDNSADFSASTPSPRATGSALSPCFAELAPYVSSTSPADAQTSVVTNSNISVTFSEAVNVAGSWFNISCSTSGAHTAVVSGGPTIFTLNPNADFSPDETCTVTIVAAQVTDQDANDPPDAMNADYVFSFTTSLCGAAATAIHDIQGSGASSPVAGNTVNIEGVVVGDFQGTSKLRGFFVQSKGGDFDLDSNTSEGIFVFDGSSPATDVNVGDVVHVSGTVHESSQMTRIDTVTNVIVCDTGYPINVSPLTLPVATLTDFEPYEGMAVTFPQPLTVSDNSNLGRFGEVTLSFGGRLPAPTNLVQPGAQAIAQADANSKNAVLLSDGSDTQNPDPTPFLFDEPNTVPVDPTLRIGNVVTDADGVMFDTNGTYRVMVTSTPLFTIANPRTVAPAATPGTLKIASLPLLNYYNGDGLGGGFPTSRGATTAAELTRQTDKLVALLTALNADVYAVQELENDNPAAEYSAEEQLVDSLNIVVGAGTYSFIDTGVVGVDEIRNGFLYKPAKVTPVGTTATLTTGAFTSLSRAPVAQAFQEVASGKEFILVNNQFKSKGAACAGDPDTGDGQGNCNLTRVQSATELLAWLATNPTATAITNTLLIGDFNCYLQEDPQVTLESAGYQNLVKSQLGTSAYSLVIFGLSGALSNAFASSALQSKISDVQFYHTDADEPSVLDYNTEFKSASQQLLETGTQYRASDHDALIVGLNFAEANLAVQITNDTPDPVAPNQNITYTIDLSNGGIDADSVDVEDNVPANTTFVSAAILSGTGWSITAPSPGATGKVTFSKSLVASAEAAQFSLVVHVNAATPNGTTISNTAKAATTTAESDLTNNSDTETTSVSGGSFLLADDFEDDTQSWTVKKGAWSETGGALHGTGSPGALIYAPLPWSPSGQSTCTNCTIDVNFSTAGGPFSVVFIEGWVQNGSNKVDIIVKEQNDKIILKQKSGGAVVAKGKASVQIDPNTSYHLSIAFDGATFHLALDGNEILALPAGGPLTGNVSFKVKNTSAAFEDILIY